MPARPETRWAWSLAFGSTAVFAGSLAVNQVWQSNQIAKKSQRPVPVEATSPTTRLTSTEIAALGARACAHNSEFSYEQCYRQITEPVTVASVSPAVIAESAISQESCVDGSSGPICVTPQQYQAWSRVNNCEEQGKWNISGQIYSGGLGISNVNWTKFSTESPNLQTLYAFPSNAADATPAQQIIVAERIQAEVGGWVPDQNNDCLGW